MRGNSARHTPTRLRGRISKERVLSLSIEVFRFAGAELYTCTRVRVEVGLCSASFLHIARLQLWDRSHMRHCPPSATRSPAGFAEPPRIAPQRFTRGESSTTDRSLYAVDVLNCNLPRPIHLVTSYMRRSGREVWNSPATVHSVPLFALFFSPPR
jgi:hypothetical protein